MRWQLQCSGFLVLAIMAWVVAPSRIQALSLRMTPLGTMRTLSTSKRIHTARSAAKGSNQDFSYSTSLDIEEITPEQEPELLPLHGPAVIGNEVSYRFPCTDSIVDLNENLWNFTSQMHLFGPDGNEVSPRPESHWVSEKMSMQSSQFWNLTDPLEGEYTCKTDWWVDEFYLGQSEDKKTLSYVMPTGEASSADNTWFISFGEFTAHLSVPGGANLSGRVVHEANGGNLVDTCHYPGSPIPEHPGVPASMWDTPATINSSNEYLDRIGMGPGAVACYRAQGPNCFIPVNTCQWEGDQWMYINRPGASPVDQIYKTNRVKMGMTATTIWSERDGHAESTPW